MFLFLQEEDEDAYKRQFSGFIKKGVTADGIEEMYRKAHDAIRKNPVHTKKVAKVTGKPKRWTAKKLTLEERKARVKAAKEQFLAQIEDQKE